MTDYFGTDFNRNLHFLVLMQTAKINQGNTALKRVVESIANGDSHVPFRDSKLTMLLQVYQNLVLSCVQVFCLSSLFWFIDCLSTLFYAMLL